MKSFKQLIAEVYVDTVTVSVHGYSQQCEVFKNPSSSELRELFDGGYGSIRAIILDESDIYCFPASMLHAYVFKHFKIKDGLGLTIYGAYPASKDIEIGLSDTSFNRNSKWLTADYTELETYIRNNKYLNSIFKITGIGD